MYLEIHPVDLQASDALHEFVRRHVERALRPFQASVGRVDVHLRDVNEPHGEVVKRCRVTAELATGKRKVVVNGTNSDAHEAVRAACGRLGERVLQALTRRRHLGRPSAQPPEAAGPTPAAPPPGSAAATPEEPSRIQVTIADYERLSSLIGACAGARDHAAAEALADELDRAEVVPAERIAGNVVTMNSRVLFEDQQTGEAREVSLVYPPDSDVERGRISVLAPVGSALLGLSVGQTIDWPLPGGQVKRLRVVQVVYQPEEAGHFHL